MKVTVHNRGPEAARIHLLPTLWFRNAWTWDGEPKPVLSADGAAVRTEHPDLGTLRLACDGARELLFTENETNAFRLWGQPNPTPFVQDAFHEYVVNGRGEAVNPGRTGTKAAAHHVLDIPAGGASTGRRAPSSTSTSPRSSSS